MTKTKKFTLDCDHREAAIVAASVMRRFEGVRVHYYACAAAEGGSMSERDDGGPAFPSDPGIQLPNAYQGMTLLDWFAGQALAVTPPEALDEAAGETGGNIHDIAAACAYRIAEAMIAEKRRRGEA